MPAPSFGTAQFGNLRHSVQPGQLLQTAWDAGFRRFDTAALYDHGRSETALGAFLRGRTEVEKVTTKVGLLPGPERPVRDRLVGAAKAALPTAVTRRLKAVLRPADHGPPQLHSGRFAVDDVRASVETSLRRLGGRVDRLLLHEVLPHDVTPELMALLDRYVHQGDVAELGVATQNHHTLAALAAGGKSFTAANIAVGPLHEPVVLPAHVRTRIGHGLLGGGGEHLRLLQGVLASDAVLRDRWATATTGTEFDGARGLGDALLARAAELDVDEVLVASTRLQNVAPAYRLAVRADPLPPTVHRVITDLVDAVVTP